MRVTKNTAQGAGARKASAAARRPAKELQKAAGRFRKEY